MRLSDIKGERTLDVIADCIEPIANIAADPEAARLFKREKLPEGADANAYLIERMRKSVPPLIKGHKNDVITILASVEGISNKQYAETLNLPKLINDALELMTDKTFISLFQSAQSTEEPISSGSAQENTGEPLA